MNRASDATRSSRFRSSAARAGLEATAQNAGVRSSADLAATGAAAGGASPFPVPFPDAGPGAASGSASRVAIASSRADSSNSSASAVARVAAAAATVASSSDEITLSSPGAALNASRPAPASKTSPPPVPGLPPAPGLAPPFPPPAARSFSFFSKASSRGNPVARRSFLSARIIPVRCRASPASTAVNSAGNDAPAVSAMHLILGSASASIAAAVDALNAATTASMSSLSGVARAASTASAIVFVSSSPYRACTASNGASDAIRAAPLASTPETSARSVAQRAKPSPAAACAAMNVSSLFDDIRSANALFTRRLSAIHAELTSAPCSFGNAVRVHCSSRWRRS